MSWLATVVDVVAVGDGHDVCSAQLINRVAPSQRHIGILCENLVKSLKYFSCKLYPIAEFWTILQPKEPQNEPGDQQPQAFVQKGVNIM